jgi:glycine/sarcosine N-methyltransferase
MTEDAYQGFAERYDLFSEEFGKQSPQRMEFFRRIFRENGISKVLDCACGTGRDLVMFDSLGVEVAGSDISPSMLEQARKNLARLGLEIPLRQVDFRELPGDFAGKFDAVACLSSSLLEAGGEKGTLRALRSMYGVLEDKGILVISQGTTDKQWAAKPRFICMVNRPDFSRLLVADYLDRGARYNILDLFHGAGRDELIVWSKEYPVILLRDDYEALIESAGFSPPHFYGSYTFEPYDKKCSDMLLAVAHK